MTEPSRREVMNFGSGPGALPPAALELAQRELLDFGGTGMSLLEQSHRGAVYDAVHEETRALFRELLALPDSHDVLLLQGGASQQFANVPMNLLGKEQRAGYAVTGVWGQKALDDARSWSLLTSAHAPAAITTRDAERGYVRLPSPAELDGLGDGLRYIHCTSNETIHGVQWAAADIAAQLGARAPIVCDMSSDILSRPIDCSKFALIYAGAQKNLGPSGLVVVVIDKAFAQAVRKDLPQIVRYDVALEQRSLMNTPPMFSIYLTRNVLRWLKAEGGAAAMAQRNARKAETLYSALDAAAPLFVAPVESAARSQMNVVFRLASAELDAQFLEAAKARGMVGLKGHRSVGGLRAGLYNAVPQRWVDELAALIREFAAHHAG